MSEIFRRTGYGALLQTNMVMGLPVTIPASSTLNEKLSIQSTASLGINEVPKMRYLTLGIKGARHTVGADSIPLLDLIQHLPTDAASYMMFPFAMRAVDDDFTPSERNLYCLRRVETISGADYAVYYGIRLDMTNVVPKLVKKTILNNVTTAVDFFPSSENLNPVPPPIPPAGTIPLEGEYICALAELEITFTPTMVEEILNAAMVKYNNENYALISELGLVSGVDRAVNMQDSNGQTVSYNEVVAAQIFTHVSTLIPFKSQRAGFAITLDCGASEPMFDPTL